MTILQHTSAASNILLDAQIRDWVVIPLFVIMVCAGLLRFHVGNLLKPSPKNQSLIVQRTQSLAKFTSALKTGSTHFLSTSRIQARFVAYPELLRDQAEWIQDYAEQKEKEESEKSPDDVEMPNPLAAMDGMKGNMAFMIQNMVMMQGIQHFFSGFILLKVPFPLTIGFKQMFQRGMESIQLDTSYVSSVSWYFLVMFGLRGFFQLVIGQPSQETQENMLLWNKLGKKPGGGSPLEPDADKQAKMLNQEADNLEVLMPKNFKSDLDSVEKRLLGSKYPKKSATVGKDDFLMLHQKSGSKKKN